MSATFYSRDIQGRGILLAVNLLRGLRDGLHVLVTGTRIDFHFFSNRNGDAIILSGCGGLEKGHDTLQSLISKFQSQKILRLWTAHAPVLFLSSSWIIQPLHRCMGCFCMFKNAQVLFKLGFLIKLFFPWGFKSMSVWGRVCIVCNVWATIPKLEIHKH